MTAAAPPASAASGELIEVTVFDANDSQLGLVHRYYADELSTLPGQDVQNLNYTSYNPTFDLGAKNGISIRAFLSQLPLPVDSVAEMTFNCGSGTSVATRLSAASHDFDDPDDSVAYPFKDGNPPVLNPFTDGGVDGNYVFDFTVQTRIDHSDTTVTDGKTFCGGLAQTLKMTVHLASRTLPTTFRATSPATVTSGGSVAFAATVQDETGDVTWHWVFGDGTTKDTREPTVTHTYTGAPGSGYDASVTVTDALNYQGQSSSVPVAIKGSSTPTSPAPTTSGRGTGGTTAPNRGPATGSGPRAGGVATGRTGPTGAGASFDPRSSGAPSASGSATPQPGTAISGFALSEPSLAAAAPRAGSTPRNDAAAASRAGSTTSRLGPWLLGGLAVVVLLAVGVLSERRRPRHRGRPPA